MTTQSIEDRLHGIWEGALSPENAPPQVLLIAGPTASGKTALAVALARAGTAAIVNADSMQVYADLAILSARPSAAEQEGVPHRLFGHVEAHREYNVGAYVADVGLDLAAAQRSGQRLVFVGGTGLFFRALTEGLVATPAIAPEIMAEVSALSPEALASALRREDPEAASVLSPADVPRLQRALAVQRATGRSLRAWQRTEPSVAPLAGLRWQGLFLNPPRDVLTARIDRRFLSMMDRGALEETAALASLGLPHNRGIMKAHGMPHLCDHLAGRLTREEAIALGQRDTRRYAKRQLTWARQFMREWLWLEPA